MRGFQKVAAELPHKPAYLAVSSAKDPCCFCAMSAISNHCFEAILPIPRWEKFRGLLNPHVGLFFPHQSEGTLPILGEPKIRGILQSLPYFFGIFLYTYKFHSFSFSATIFTQFFHSLAQSPKHVALGLTRAHSQALCSWPIVFVCLLMFKFEFFGREKCSSA